MILIPVKQSSNAKQRLSAILDQPARTQLAQAMLQDILETLAAWKSRPEVVLVTNDPFACSQAKKFSFEIIEDPANISETAAIEMATDDCIKRGADNTLVIPGDIPLTEAWELERILDAAPDHGSVLVPAADGRGSNAVFRRPAALFPLRFGNDSFKPHLAAAKATGMPCVVLESPGIAVDVDGPEDLLQIVTASGDRRSQRLARQWNIAEKVAALR
jgi:2-phospho-L-lactate guanylyltransferase